MVVELAEYGFVGKLFVAEGDTVEVRHCRVWVWVWGDKPGG